ncbi:MAG: monovalent cation/H+ antiporter complex subunit F [Defluviitaleaceae bacterium]|nr:monovalent cation/H+ antiporter complex subunit F [Defluviitaleaceae bacterium]
MYYVLWIMLIFLFLYCWRVIKGPSIWDRLLGMNIISTKIIILIVFFAADYGLAYLLDFAIIYALFGFIGVIFIALFLAERSKSERRK